MASKDTIRYAKELLSKGFTRDSARNIMLSRNYNFQEIDKALNAATSSKKNLNITTLLAIAVLLIVVLIPTVLILTKDKEELDEDEYEYEGEPSGLGEGYPSQKEETQQFQCAGNEECLFNEQCQNGICIKIFCTSCEEAFEHQCIPIQCQDNDTCTSDSCSEGNCLFSPITECLNDDGCCADGCNETNDTDCSLNLTSGCIANLDCDDGDYLTVDECKSPSEGLPKQCFNTIPGCQNDDFICGENCTTLTDNDCDAICGNNVVEEFEECDGNCPTNCNDNNTCTTDTLLGSSGLCTAECIYNNITVCIHNDLCCPTGCVFAGDNDCPPNSTLFASGNFSTVQQITTGGIEIYYYEDNTYKVKFNSLFSISNTQLDPNLKVYLATAQTVSTKAQLDAGNYYLEPLQELSGEQEYDVPQSITSLQDYNSVVIFHESYNAVYSYATINYNI